MLSVWRPCINIISYSSNCLQNTSLRLVRFAHKISINLCLEFFLFIFPSIYYYTFRKLIVCVLNFDLRELFFCFIISRTFSQAIIRVLAKQKPGLKIIHLNSQSLAKNIEEFRFLFINSNIDVICLSETWLVICLRY